MENTTTSSVRPRFSRGQERDPEASVAHVVPRFSRGQERMRSSHDKEHEGEFAAGQERFPHHPEREYHGRFSRGQEEGSERARRTTRTVRLVEPNPEDERRPPDEPPGVEHRLM